MELVKLFCNLLVISLLLIIFLSDRLIEDLFDQFLFVYVEDILVLLVLVEKVVRGLLVFLEHGLDLATGIL